MSNETLYHRLNDDYATPDWIKEGMFGGWFDPCPLKGRTKISEMNGLQIEWADKTFCNPPYSNPMPWVMKAIKESRKNKTIVLLVKHDSSTRWYNKLHEAGAYFISISERLHFNNGQGAPFPSILAVLYPKDVEPVKTDSVSVLNWLNGGRTMENSQNLR